MLPLHRKEKLDDVRQNSFPYRFAKPAMFTKQRGRFSPRQINIGGFALICFLLWLIFHGGEKGNRHKSPYAVNSHYLGDGDVLPIVDITIQECTRWRWFESRSKCTQLLKEGWEVSGGDLMLGKGSNWVHLFVKREALGSGSPAITELQISNEHPKQHGTWEARPGGIWMIRRTVSDVKDAVTAIDFIHGKDIRELRRGRQFVEGGNLLLGSDINLSFRKGKPPPRQFPKLKITETKPYKVLQVADLHLSTDAGECRDIVTPYQKLECEADANSLKFLNYVLDSEKPDFVAFTGDQVNGDTAPNAKTAIFKFAELCIDRKIPYAAIFGNHDDEGDLSREDLMNVLAELPYSVSKAGLKDIQGIGNYVVAIEKPKTKDIALAFWFLDTHKYSPNERKYPGYDWLKINQIAWFKWQHEQLAPWPKDSLQAAFIHIPLTEYRTVTNAIIGSWRESPTAPVFNSGFRDALAEKDIMVLTAGHDHANDYCMLDEMKHNRAEKTWMCYGGGVGYGGYGGYGGYKRRLRIFEFDVARGRIKTWKRVDEDIKTDPLGRIERLEEQILVDKGVVSKVSLDVQIEGTNMTLMEYYENLRPPDLAS